MAKYILSCESTVDMPYDYIKGRNIEVIHYTYLMEDQIHEDDMSKDEAKLLNFYEKLHSGTMASTTQINQQEYWDYFTKLIEKTDEVLHITFGSGLSGSVANAVQVAKEINEQHKDKRVVVIDSIAGSSGYGMLVDMVADMRDEGKSIDEIVPWIKANRLRIHHYVYTTDLTYLKRGGRVTATEAMIGNLLSICPMIYMDKKGKLKVFSKLRGRKKVAKKFVEMMEQYIEEGTEYKGRCYISHANAMEDAKYLKGLIEEKFPHLKGKVGIFNVGVVIGCHTGQGALGMYFFGVERPNLTK